MTKISKAAMAKSRKLIVDEANRMRWRDDPKATALARYIQETSDVAKHVAGVLESAAWPDVPTQTRLRSLVLPDDPVDPVEAVADDLFGLAYRVTLSSDTFRASFRAALAKHSLTITAKE